MTAHTIFADAAFATEAKARAAGFREPTYYKGDYIILGKSLGQFYTPEMFWGMDGRIVCLPLEVE